MVSRTSVPGKTIETIRDFGVTKAYVIGGTGVIGEAVVTQLRNAGVRTIVRIAGQDRYYTSAMVASEVVRLTDSVSKVFVASGENFPDALAITPAAVSLGAPILLTRKTGLPSPIAYELNSRRYREAYVIGGAGAVGPGVYSKIPNLRETLAGTDRYHTAAIVADYGVEMRWFAQGIVGIANFRSFPDALSGGHACGMHSIPLVGVEAATVPTATWNFLRRSEYSGEAWYVFGGTGAVSASTFTRLVGLHTPG